MTVMRRTGMNLSGVSLLPVLLYVLLFGLSCAGSRHYAAPGAGSLRHNDSLPPPSTLPGEFQLGVGDTVRVQVWRNDDLNRTVRIDSSGYIDFPLVGRVAAAGMTVSEFRDTITEHLGETYFLDPRVDVSVQDVQSRRLYVMGEVRNPGMIGFEAGLSLHEAIAQVGGFTTDANRERVLLVRRTQTGEGLAEAVRVDDMSWSGQPADGTAFLRNRDIVYVVPLRIASVARFMSRLNTILGPILSLESGVIMGNEAINILTGQSDDGKATPVTIPATR